jgi:hypothetical protein
MVTNQADYLLGRLGVRARRRLVTVRCTGAQLSSWVAEWTRVDDTRKEKLEGLISSQGCGGTLPDSAYCETVSGKGYYKKLEDVTRVTAPVTCVFLKNAISCLLCNFISHLYVVRHASPSETGGLTANVKGKNSRGGTVSKGA